EILNIPAPNYIGWNREGGISFAADSKRAALWCAGTVYLWERGIKQPREFKTSSVAALSPDGKTLACADNSRIVLWDVDTQKEREPLVGHEQRISALAFSPDGSRLASGTEAGINSAKSEVKLWDVAKRRAIGTTAADTRVNTLGFLAQGKLLR